MLNSERESFSKKDVFFYLHWIFFFSAEVSENIFCPSQNHELSIFRIHTYMYSFSRTIRHCVIPNSTELIM